MRLRYNTIVFIFVYLMIQYIQIYRRSSILYTHCQYGANNHAAILRLLPVIHAARSNYTTSTTPFIRSSLQFKQRQPYTTGEYIRSFASLIINHHDRIVNHNLRSSSEQNRNRQSRTFFITPNMNWFQYTLRNNNNSLLTITRTASTNTTTNTNPDDTTYDYDYFVIGAGSGGIASARRAASYPNVKVAIAESMNVIGGTCVNMGCVPKKIMYHAAHIADTIHDMDHYGFAGTEHITFDWHYIKHARDQYIRRLNTIYERNLETSNVTRLYGTASFPPNSTNTILLTPNDGSPSKIIKAKHILIATGGKPIIQYDIPGVAEYAISSDGFFALEELPRKAVIVGGGYIAVELAGILQALGTETKLVVRKEKALRSFDTMLSDALNDEMIRQGIVIYRNTDGIQSITLNDDGTKKVYLKNGEIIDDMNVVIVATGRIPNVETLQLDNIDVIQTTSGHIVTNEYCETNVNGVYALGDVVGRIELTPTAIAAGRRLADRLFGGMNDAKISYDLVPTVIFSHPTIGTIGLTEQQAIAKYGMENIKIYKSKFSNLFYGPWQVDPDDKPKTAMKLICAGRNELVVGLHVIGMGADEMLQGFGIAMKMGATKADFDATVAIHPTAAEEFVTMYPWGLLSTHSGAKHSPLNGAAPPEPIL